MVKREEKWKNLIIYIVVGMVFYFLIRFLSAALFPFIIAYLLLKMFYPLTTKIKDKLKINSGITMAVLVFLLLAILMVSLWWLLSNLFDQLSSVFRNAADYQGKMDGLLADCCTKIEQVLGLKVEYVKPYLLSRFYIMTEKLGESITSGIMSYSYQYAKVLIKIIAMVVVVIVSAVVMTKDYERLMLIFKKAPLFYNAKKIKDKVFHAGIVYLRAQLILLAITIVLCVLTLKISGQRNALLLGSAIGALDALPFLGTGSILIPWAIVKMFRAEFLQASIYVSLYLVCSFVREFMEPRLIGKDLGIPSIFIIASIYLGIVFFGAAGVVLGPLHVVLTIEVGRQWIEDH